MQDRFTNYTLLTMSNYQMIEVEIKVKILWKLYEIFP